MRQEWLSSPHYNVPFSTSDTVVLSSVISARIRVSGPARLILRLGLLSRLSGLLASGQGVDLLSRSHEASVILLPEFGSNLVESHEHRGLIGIIFNLQSRTDMLERNWNARRTWWVAGPGLGRVKGVVIHREVR